MAFCHFCHHSTIAQASPPPVHLRGRWRSRGLGGAAAGAADLMGGDLAGARDAVHQRGHAILHLLDGLVQILPFFCEDVLNLTRCCSEGRKLIDVC